jgi:hypothetical protein
MVFLCALPIAALAQSTMGGSIDGTVTDPNGGVVPAAKVTATNTATGVSTVVSTSGAGVYGFPLLPPGPYTIRVEQGGFKVLVREGIEVRLALNETINLTLELGTVQQHVEVKGQAPLLTTNNPTTGMNMSPQTLDSLPVWFGGGIRQANSFIAYMPNEQANSQQTFEGAAGRATEIMIDGGSVVSPESGGIQFYPTGMEQYSETKIITSGPTADLGRTGGGFQLYTTKSGTNDVHGSMFFNFERQFFNAVAESQNASAAQRGSTSATGVITVPAQTECNAPQATACRPLARYNDEGGSAGGPVYIPHVYDGRNKTFFFFTYEGYWQPAAFAQNTGLSVPTVAEVQGNFQQIYGATNPVIYDPATTAGGVRTPFGAAGAYNIIPTNRFSKISSNFLPLIPTPNVGSGTTSPNGDFFFNQSTVLTDREWSIKIDHSLGTKSHFAFFETHRYSPSNVVEYLPGPISDGLLSTTDPHQFNASWDWVATPHVVLHSYWSGHFDNQSWFNPLQNGYGCKLGFTELMCGTNQDATPQITFPGSVGGLAGGATTYTGWGMNQGKVNNGLQLNHILMEGQDLTWTRNKHEFKMGWMIRRSATLSNDWSTSNGIYNYNNGTTALQAGSTTTGDAFAGFLLGDPTSATQGGLPIYPANIRYAYTDGYFMDTWKIKPNLTFNLGIRYEVPINWHYVDGGDSSFNPTLLNAAAGNLPGAIQFMGNGPGHIGSDRPYPTDFTDIGPRLGFAWQVEHNTVVRGAFGLIYEGTGNGDCGCVDGYAPPAFGEAGDGFDPALQWDNNPNGVPGVYQQPGYSGARQIPSVDNFAPGNNESIGSLAYMGPKWGVAPRIYDMNFTVQHQYHGWLFQLGYQGQRTHNGPGSDYLNVLPASDLPLMRTPTVLTGTGGVTVPAGTNLLAYNFNTPAQATVLNALGYYAPSGNGSLNSTCAGWTTCWTTGWGSASTLFQALRPFPQVGFVANFNDGNGWISYDSMVLIVEHRFGDLNLETSYVRSKNLDIDFGDQIFGYYQGAQQNQDPENRADNKTFANADLPNMVNFTASYLLPFGRGKKFLGSSNSVVNKVVSGWTIAGVGQYRSGTLIAISSPTNNLGTYLGWQFTKADYTGAPIKTNVATNTLDPNNPSIRWFTTTTSAAAITASNPTGATGSASFVQAPIGTLGNSSLYNNQFRNPWVRNENLSLNKLIGIWNEGKVSLRYTLYVQNPFQRTDFGGITSGITSTSFGRPTGVQDGARVMSMGLRLYF